MDSPQYLIRKIETCPECHGAKFFQNADWEALNIAFDMWMTAHDKTRMDDEAYAEWNHRKSAAFPCGEPPEEEPCPECEGTGTAEKWIDLREALQELGVTDANGHPVTVRKPHMVWCSCGKTTVCTWDPNEQRYVAQQKDDGLWWFSSERGGWTCDPALDHRQAKAVELRWPSEATP